MAGQPIKKARRMTALERKMNELRELMDEAR